MEAKDKLLERITVEPGKRGGQPCIRNMRITVGDILGWLDIGMTHDEIVDDFPYLEKEDIDAAVAYDKLQKDQTMTIYYVKPREAAIGS